MKQVYQANDGTVYDTVKEAEHREQLLKDISSVQKSLPTHTTSSNSGYYQLTQKEVNRFKEEIRILIGISQPTLVSIYDKCPDGIIGKYLQDSNSPIYSLYCTLICIDSSNKMWGQPYFACNPGRGKQVNLRRQ